MEQNPLCIAFASQKGGVGKSTLTVLAASWLHYLHGIRVAVVDCDYPQHSILKLSNRDKAVVQSSAIYGRLLVSLAENKGVKPYRILCCKPSEAMAEWRKWAAVAEERYDVVLFDLPGTVGNEGVLSTIVELDYLFIPMKADRIVLESTLNFTSVLNDRLIKTGRAHLRELFLFWNLVDRRERTPLYEQYEKVLDQLGLQHLRTHIPVRSNFNKDIQETGGPVYRCTLLPPDRAFVAECGFDRLMTEICAVLKLPSHE